jgi:DNA repair exonuclease SbcCD nuclease subunit
MEIKNRYIGTFSDIHLGLGQDSPIWHEIMLDFAAWASGIYHKCGIEEIIIPGDVFHNRSQISVETLTVAKKFFDYFKDFKAVYISTGNHDCYKKDKSDINSIKLLDGWQNIHVIDDKPLILDTHFNKKIGLVPWGTEIENFPKCDVIFAHIEINSFYMNSYKVCEHGFSYKDLFKYAPVIISGHFHKMDHREYNDGEIIYLGSPYQHNFGDVGDARGIYVYDIQTNQFKFIENKISPKHIKVNVKGEINEDKLKNNFVSLIVDDKIEDQELHNIKAKIFSNAVKGLKIELNDDVDNLNTSLSADSVLETSDLMKSIEEYVESLSIENKKEVVEHIKSLYNNLT